MLIYYFLIYNMKLHNIWHRVIEWSRICWVYISIKLALSCSFEQEVEAHCARGYQFSVNHVSFTNLGVYYPVCVLQWKCDANLANLRWFRRNGWWSWISHIFANAALTKLAIGEFNKWLTACIAILSVMLCYFHIRLVDHDFFGGKSTSLASNCLCSNCCKPNNFCWVFVGCSRIAPCRALEWSLAQTHVISTRRFARM